MPQLALRPLLWPLALTQHGHFTVTQATRAGLDPSVLRHALRRGVLERTSRGVYRFSDFPRGELDDRVAATLWPTDVRGVLSHETALDLYGVCDVRPTRLHVTVPPDHRVRRATPPHLVVHAERLDDVDRGTHRGLPIVTLERAIHEALDDRLAPRVVAQAIENGRACGLLGHTAADVLADAPAGVPRPDVAQRVAVKLHACSEQPDAGHVGRARDLCDLVLLDDLIDDWSAVRAACLELFSGRYGHAFPPELVERPGWRAGFAPLARELAFPFDLDETLDAVRELIANISARRG